MSSDKEMIRVSGLTKSFTLHNQGGLRLPVFADVELTVSQGECLILTGPSGAGKSTLLRSLFANYLPESGSVLVRHGDEWVDLVSSAPHRIMAVRAETLGYVSQFLRVIPRVPTLDLVMEPLLIRGTDPDEAMERAEALLDRLNIPTDLRRLPPATFSGGEQQRVNIAMGFVRNDPVLLLDEPTASLDAANRQVVIELIDEARGRGAAIVGIFHDPAVRAEVGTREFNMTEVRKAA